jgi:DNA recombination protein Rad52
MNKTIEEVTKLLNEKIPRDAVATRSGGGSKALSYLETWYVIDRLNAVFGNTGWDSETVEMRLVSEPGALPAYCARVRITACVSTGDGGYMKIVKEGTGWGSDKSKLNPHEMASKEAESDALKRAAMKFGRSLGLALYDKSQEFVENEMPKQLQEAKGRFDAAFPNAGKTLEMLTEHQADAVNKRQASQYPEPSRDTINKKITAMSKVVLSKAGPENSEPRIAKAKLLKEIIAEYGAGSKEALNDGQAKELLARLEKMANG